MHNLQVSEKTNQVQRERSTKRHEQNGFRFHLAFEVEDNNWFTRWSTKTGWKQYQLQRAAGKRATEKKKTKLWIGKMGIPSFRFFVSAFKVFSLLQPASLCAGTNISLSSLVYNSSRKSENFSKTIFSCMLSEQTSVLIWFWIQFIRECSSNTERWEEIDSRMLWKKKYLVFANALFAGTFRWVCLPRSPIAHCANMSQHENEKNRRWGGFVCWVTCNSDRRLLLTR